MSSRALPVETHGGTAGRDAPEPCGSDAVLRALEAEGVEVCFGMPGGAILPIYDAFARGTTIRHVLVRHEQGAGHMAQGYSRASGRPGVVFATSGPGATNLVTPIADAWMDSTPLVCITGQVRTDLMGTDAFQECDITGVTMPIVKRSWLVRDAAELPEIIHAAVRIATSGRPGPVLVDIPRDVQEAPCPGAGTPATGQLVPPAVTTGFDKRLVAQAAQTLVEAKRPILYVGGGAQSAAPQVLKLAETTQLPVVTTLMGKGAFPETHPLFFGWPGMHGCRAANLALHRADLIVAAGARFDDRVTGRLDAFAPEAKVVHIDIDPHEHNKIRHAEIPIHGRLDVVLEALAAATGQTVSCREPWLAELRGYQQRYPLRYGTAVDVLKAQDVVRHLSERTADHEDVVWTTGVGQHQMWAMQHVTVDRPRSFVTSGGLGTMGFGLPAAIGARAARPDATVICIDGDGSFQMTLQELATAVSGELPVIVVILNNGQLGMVHQWQSMFYAERLSQVDLRAAMPDFAMIARGYGALGFTVRDFGELDAALDEAFTAGRAAVIDVHVDPAEVCFPMIMPGGAAAEQREWEPAP
jgi:acetolactate synthase I/II/III large subunit